MESGLGHANDRTSGLEGDTPDNAKDCISGHLKADTFDNPNFVKTKGGLLESAVCKNSLLRSQAGVAVLRMTSTVVVAGASTRVKLMPARS